MNDNLETSKNGEDLIIYWEEDKKASKPRTPHLKAYRCPAGQITIGFGNTFYEDRSLVKMGDEISEERAWELFRNSLKDYEKQVKHLVSIDLEQYEFDALVSFFWNAVYSQLIGSNTLKLLNEGNKAGFLDYHKKWVGNGKKNADGSRVILKGLVKRREQEARLFEGKDWNDESSLIQN